MDRQPGFAVVDLETTGFSNADRIVEIGVVLLRPDLTVERTWETLIQPERDIPNSYIHKITASDVVDAPAFRDVAAYLGSLLNGRTLVAHNASFEHRFLTNEFNHAHAHNGLCQPWLDTMKLAKQHLGCAKLSDALTATNINNPLAHSALADAQATADLLRHLYLHCGADVSGYPAASFTAQAEECRSLPRGTEASWSGQLSRTLPASGAKDENAYRSELTRVLVDRHISRTEIRQLEHTAIASGLDADDVEAINEEFTRQLAIEAWSDGVITDNEREELTAVAEALGVDPARVQTLLCEPQAGTAPAQFALQPGDRIALTGAMDIPRDEWAQRATAADLDVGDVTKKCALLVAANPDSMSGKAQKARKYGIPIVGETKFAQLLSAIDHESAPEQSAAAEQSADNAEHEAPEQFSWLSPEQVRTTGTSTSRIAAAWIALHPNRPLHEMADNLQPHHIPEATGRGIDRYLAVWSLEHPEMLSGSADDLLDLPGVGPKRRSQLVEMVVDLAADGVAEVPEAAPVEPASEFPNPTGPWPSFDDEPATDPTPEEILAKAHASSYNPYAVPIPATTTPLEPAPQLPVERTNRAAKVFKWSAIIAVASFFLFGMCLETFDPEAESFIAGLFAVAFLFGGLTAAVSGIWALVNRLRR